MSWIGTVDAWLTEAESLQNAQMVADICATWGWSKNAICGLCGNMRHESSLNPNVWEFGYNHSTARGYGLVQWTPASNVIDWCTAQSLDYTNGDNQMKRINYEKQQGIQWISTSEYPLSFNEFSVSSQTVSYLTWAFARCYERPLESALQDSIAARIAFAELCATTLTFGGNGGTTFSPAFPTLAGTPITSPFGERVYNGQTVMHYGIDLGGAANDPIYATMNGTVVKSTYDAARGNYVIVKHSEDSYYSTYQHNASNSVIVGATVTRGQTIALMGTTGDSTGVHLHFAISTTPYGSYADDGNVGVFIDPEVYLASVISGGGTTPPTTSKMSALIHLLLSNQLYGAW